MGWTQTEKSGDWTYADHNRWLSPYSGNYSYFSYQDNRTNFNRWSYVVRLTRVAMGGLWDIEKVQQLAGMTLVDSEDVSKISVYIGHEIATIVYGYVSVKTWVTVQVNDTTVSSIWVLRDMDVEVHIWRSEDEKITISYFLLIDYTTKAANEVRENINVSLSSSWFSNVNFREKIEKQFYTWGFVQGEIEGDKPYEVIGTGGPIGKPYNVMERTLSQIAWEELWNALNTIKLALWSLLPSSITAFLDQAWEAITSFGNLAWTLIHGFGVVLFSNIPLILGAYGLYLVYLIVSCVDKGTFTPLFNHFLRMTEILMAIGHVALMIIHVIVDLVKWYIPVWG